MELPTTSVSNFSTKTRPLDVGMPKFDLRKPQMFDPLGCLFQAGKSCISQCSCGSARLDTFLPGASFRWSWMRAVHWVFSCWLSTLFALWPSERLGLEIPTIFFYVELSEFLVTQFGSLRVLCSLDEVYRYLVSAVRFTLP